MLILNSYLFDIGDCGMFSVCVHCSFIYSRVIFTTQYSLVRISYGRDLDREARCLATLDLLTLRRSIWPPP